jgi:hypothetical protein
MIALAFAVVFFIDTCSSLFYVADYYINTAMFAENCINKDKPQMHCNGKCQLQKKINTENTNDKQNPERKNNNLDEVLSSKTFFASLEIAINPVSEKKYFITNTGILTDRSFRFFHPPKPVQISSITNQV